MVTSADKRRAAVTLPSDTQVRIQREFDAARHLVYRAWTTPELIKRWWSAKRGTATIADVDLRVGGAWRWVMIADRGGVEVAFRGVYKEIVPNERLVYTEIYEAVPGAGALTTVTFAEHAGRTTVTILVDHETKANRDAHVNSGMEGGLQDALDLLEDVATSLAG
jgi:uncharacterized protein YndB with AHSA1/START domain